MVAASRRFVGIRSSLVKPILSQVFIGITLITARVSRSPVTPIFNPLMSSRCAVTTASCVLHLYCILFHHGVMAYPADFEFLFTQIDLPYPVTVCCYISPSVDTSASLDTTHRPPGSVHGVSLCEGHLFLVVLAQLSTQCVAPPASDNLHMCPNASK